MSGQSRPAAWSSPLWLLGHALQYLGLVVQVVFEYDLLRYVVYAGLALQASAILLGGMWLRPMHGRRAIAALGLYLVVCAATGLLNRNWISYFAIDLLIFSATLAFFAGADPKNVARLVQLYSWILPIGLVGAVFVIRELGPRPRSASAS
jgi:hypothetical protein